MEDSTDFLNRDDIRHLRMENWLMNRCIPGRQQLRDDTYMLVVNALKNLHSTKHSKSCFKKNEYCRMKIPVKPEVKTTVIHCKDTKEWYDWRGRNSPRKLFVYSPKRAFEDAYVNLYNDYTTRLCGWNSNVVTGCDGGSAMYCTCYVGKGTQEEDSEAFNTAAKCMVRCTANKVKEMEDEGKDVDVVNTFKLGMASLIGSAFMATKAHTCSATLGAFLTRKKFRFGYSHDFQWTNIHDYHRETPNDAVFLHNEGNYFVERKCRTYLNRGSKLENVCLYYFLQDYVLSPRSDEVDANIDWSEHYHGVHNVMMLHENKRKRIPIFNVFDLVDTSTFKCDIMNATYATVSTVEEQCMEDYCKVVCTLFIPFRRASDLLDENNLFLGTFQRRFRQFQQHPDHPIIKILTNIQNCRNGLRVGRPPDPLEMITEDEYHAVDKENKKKGRTLNDAETTEDLDGIGMEEYVREYQNIIPQVGNTNIYRNDRQEFTFTSDVIRSTGSHKCGFNYLSAPDDNNIHMLTNGMQVNPEANVEVDDLPRRAQYSNLYKLCIRRTTNRVI